MGADKVQIGLITVDGSPVGVVSLTEGDGLDTWTPEFGGEPSGYLTGTAHAYGDHHHYKSHPTGGEHHRHPRHDAAGHTRHGSVPNHTRAGRHPDDVGDIPTSSSGNPFDRERFAKELEQKPWLREKIKHISLGENQDPHANLAVVETMMNRAVTRGTSLEAQVRRHRSSGVDEGGYYAGYAPRYNADQGALADRSIDRALAGSNISNYATDNSSGGLAARERASGAFVHHKTINGESFFSPGSAEPAFRSRWQQLHGQAVTFEQNKKAEAAVKPFDPETMAP